MVASISKYRRKLELLRAIEEEVNADKDWQQIANGVGAIVCELRRLIEASDAVNDSWCEAATCDRPATWTVHAQHDRLEGRTAYAGCEDHIAEQTGDLGIRIVRDSLAGAAIVFDMVVR